MLDLVVHYQIRYNKLHPSPTPPPSPITPHPFDGRTRRCSVWSESAPSELQRNRKHNVKQIGHNFAHGKTRTQTSHTCCVEPDSLAQFADSHAHTVCPVNMRIELHRVKLEAGIKRKINAAHRAHKVTNSANFGVLIAFTSIRNVLQPGSFIRQHIRAADHTALRARLTKTICALLTEQKQTTHTHVAM